MFCIHCGAKIDNNARFCTNCGMEARADNAPVSNSEEASNRSASAASRGVGGSGFQEKKSTAFRGPSFKKKDEPEEEYGSKKTRYSRALINKVLSQLHNLDMDASSAAGEMRFPSSEVQSLFMKLIKKRLLVLAVIFSLAFSANAQVYKGTFPHNDGTIHIEIQGVSKDVTFLKENEDLKDLYISRCFYQGYFLSKKLKIHVEYKENFVPDYKKNKYDDVYNAICFTVHGLMPPDEPPGWSVIERTEEDLYKYNYKNRGYRIRGDEHERSATPRGDVTFDYEYTIPDEFYGCELSFRIRAEAVQKKHPNEYHIIISSGKQIVFYFIPPEGPMVETIDTEASAEADPVKPADGGSKKRTTNDKGDKEASSQEGNDMPIFDDNDEEESGTPGWVIPTSIVVAVTGGLTWLLSQTGALGLGGAAGAGKNTPKSFKKETKRRREEEENDDPEEDIIYEMRIKKDFGNTLFPGQEESTVAARIVRINPMGGCTTDMELTPRIEIVGDGYVQVGTPVMNGTYLCAKVTAPERDQIPTDTVVTFRLCGGGGRFDNRMHFKVKKAEIYFAQENLTLPAGYDEVVRLPFFVDGLNDPEVSVEILGNIDRNNPVYEVGVEYSEEEKLHYAVITEKQKEVKNRPGFCDIYSILIKANSGKVEIEREMPLYRYVMGMRIDMTGNVPCYLEEYDPARHVAKRPEASSDGKCYVPAETKINVKVFDYDMEKHKIVVWAPGLYPNGMEAGNEAVLTSYKLIPKEEERMDLVKRLHLRCDVRDSLEKDDSGSGRLCILSCQEALLDTPNVIYATIELTAQIGGRSYVAQHEMRLLSQPVRPFNIEDEKKDERIFDGLMNIRQQIWENGWYNNLFPLVHLIDMMTDGYQAEFGYDQAKVKMVQEVYMAFLDGSFAGANATPEKVTFVDEIKMAICSFAQSTNSVSKFNYSLPGILGRIGLGFITLGASEVAYQGFDLVAYSVQMGEGVVKAVESGEDKSRAILHIGVNIMTTEIDNRIKGILLQKAFNSKPVVSACNAVMKKGKELVLKGKSYFSGIRGKATINAANQSKAAIDNAAAMTKSMDKVKGKTSLSGEELEMQKAFEHNQVIAKENIENLQTSLWLAEQNPTAVNIKLRNQVVARCQQSKSTVYQLQNYNDVSLDPVRKGFNHVMKGFHDNAFMETCKDLSKQTGIPVHKIKRFKATSASAAKVEAGKKVPVDSDTTLYYEDANGKIHYFDEKQVQEIYNRNLYKEVQGVSATDQKFANRHADMLDSTVIEDVKGNLESYDVDVGRMTQADQHMQPLANPKKVADAAAYKINHWNEKRLKMLEKAKMATDPLEKTEYLALADEFGRESYRQGAKMFDNCFNGRDIERAFVNNGSKVSSKLRTAIEIARQASNPTNPKSSVWVDNRLKDIGMDLDSFAKEISELAFLIG